MLVVVLTLMVILLMGSFVLVSGERPDAALRAGDGPDAFQHAGDSPGHTAPSSPTFTELDMLELDTVLSHFSGSINIPQS